MWAKKCTITAVALALSGAFAMTAQASPITFAGSSGELAASVAFDVSGDQLLVRLTNTSLGDPGAPGDILTGVIFSITGNPTLTRVSATLAPGSVVLRGSAGPAGSVGGEWAYSNQLSKGKNNQYVGMGSIYSAGYFDGQATFPGGDLGGPPSGSVGGIGFGLTTLYDTAGNDNGGLSKDAVISNAVDFVLSGLSADFDLSWITGIAFQYGSALNEANFKGVCTEGCSSVAVLDVPEPGSPALAAAGLLGLALVSRLTKRGAKVRNR